MEFLALSYHLPANPSRYRVATWKALKELGAVYLQPGVALLPVNSGREEELKKIRDNIRRWDGSAFLLTMRNQEVSEEKTILEAFSAARNEEYADIAEKGRQLYSKLTADTTEDDAEKRRAEIRKLRRRMDRAVAHDYFRADGRQAAAESLQALRDYLPEEHTKKRDLRHVGEKAAVEKQDSDAPRERPSREMPVFLF